MKEEKKRVRDDAHTLEEVLPEKVEIPPIIEVVD